MNIWFFIILIVAFAIVIGPITMLRPSPGLRRKEQLRLYASKQGLRFSMRRLPALKTDMDQPTPMPVYYLPPTSKNREVPEWILMRTSYAHEGNFHSEWDWQTEVRPSNATCGLLKDYLPNLPASVLAISYSNLGFSVFWLENEDIQVLDLLIEMLNKLQQIEYQLSINPN
jgi:hypothetical protein